MGKWEQAHEEEVASRRRETSLRPKRGETQISQGGKALGPEEKTFLIKKGLLVVLLMLIVCYIVIWVLGMLESAWTGIISGLFLVLLLVLALIQRYRR